MSQTIFIVFDSKGSGRLVGAFDDIEKANSVLQINPNYYHLFIGELNKINLEVIHWVETEEQKEKLRDLNTSVLNEKPDPD